MPGGVSGFDTSRRSDHRVGARAGALVMKVDRGLLVELTMKQTSAEIHCAQYRTQYAASWSKADCSPAKECGLRRSDQPWRPECPLAKTDDRLRHADPAAGGFDPMQAAAQVPLRGMLFQKTIGLENTETN